MSASDPKQTYEPQVLSSEKRPIARTSCNPDQLELTAGSPIPKTKIATESDGKVGDFIANGSWLPLAYPIWDWEPVAKKDRFANAKFPFIAKALFFHSLDTLRNDP